MTIENLDSKICSGCSLCAHLCPKGSITMQPDKEGFLHPIVDKNTCIECGICYKKCPSKNDKELPTSKSRYYAVNIKNAEDLKKSSSGGVFIALAKNILNDGGYVCGCVYDNSMKATHICTNNINDVYRMMGSKYVQSTIFDILPTLRKLLEQKKKVLFVGTACQVAAVKTYIRDRENLILVDILCHGVPSPLYFKKYVSYLEKRYNGCVTNIDFRNKAKDGWGGEHRTCCTIKTKNGEKKIWPILPAYFCAFFWSLNLRESCYNCHFAGENRISDLTIGDFWGSYNYFKRLIREGISIVSVNSDKGLNVMHTIKDSFSIYEEIPKKEAKGSNTNFYHPTLRPSSRTNFYDGIDGLEYKDFYGRVYFDKHSRRKLLISIYGRFSPEFIKTLVRTLRH